MLPAALALGFAQSATGSSELSRDRGLHLAKVTPTELLLLLRAAGSCLCEL